MKKLCLLALFFPVVAFAPDELIKIKISDGITVILPSELKPMTQEDLAQRYPSVRAPLGAFTNQERVVDFSVNVSATQWPDENLEIAKKFFKAGVYNLYDKIDMLSEGIHEVHKKKFIYFEFVSRINGSRMQEGTQLPMFHYTYIQYLVEPGRALVFSFNCPKEQIDLWQPQARAIMKSVKMK